MSKNIVIQEGGEGRQLTAAKLKTALVGGGSCLWIPKDTVALGRKSITEDGAYEASADGFYGCSRVTVRGIGRVTGRDPVTGEEAEVTTEKDPQTGEEMIKTKVIPSYIRIADPPRKLVYLDGDSIDYSGMIVQLFLKSGQLFTDENYPLGNIPDSELDKPEQVAHGGGVGQGYCPNVSAAGTHLATMNNRVFAKYNSEPAECVFVERWKWDGPFLISTTYEGATYLVNGTRGYPHYSIVIDDVQYYINSGNHYAPPTTWQSSFPLFKDRSVDNATEITRRLFRQGAGDNHMTVPVNWTSPYGKGETFTDYLIITVNPATGAE